MSKSPEEIKILEDRLAYMVKCEYTPTENCIYSNFVCDYSVDSSDKCPCEWAEEINPDIFEKLRKTK